MRAVANRPRLPEFALAAVAMRWAERRVVVMGEHVWAHCGIVLVRCPLPEPVDCEVPPVPRVFAAMPWTGPCRGVVDLDDALAEAAASDEERVDENGEHVIVLPIDGDHPDDWAIRHDVVEMLDDHGVTQLEVVLAPSPRDPQVRLPYLRFRVGVVEGIVLPCGPSRGWSSEEED